MHPWSIDKLIANTNANSFQYAPLNGTGGQLPFRTCTAGCGSPSLRALSSNCAPHILEHGNDDRGDGAGRIRIIAWFSSSRSRHSDFLSLNSVIGILLDTGSSAGAGGSALIVSRVFLPLSAKLRYQEWQRIIGVRSDMSRVYWICNAKFLYENSGLRKYFCSLPVVITEDRRKSR